MKEDIWITHAYKVKEAARKKRLNDAIARKKKIDKTKCDNCGKYGAERVWFLPSSSRYHNSMASFDKNLCEDCRKKFNDWCQVNWSHSG